MTLDTYSHTTKAGENNAVIFQTPKTKKSKRTISLDPTTIKILKKWRQERQFFNFPACLKDTDILFPTEKGMPRSFDFINYHFKKILTKYKLPYIKPMGFVILIFRYYLKLEQV